MSFDADALEALLHKARRWIDRGQHLEDAIELCGQVADAVEGSEAGWNLLFEALQLIGEAELLRERPTAARKAAERLLAAAEAQPEGSFAKDSKLAGAKAGLARRWLAVAQAERSQGHHAKAHSAYERSLDVHEDVDVRLEFTDLLAESGTPEQAVQVLEAARDPHTGEPFRDGKVARRLREVRGEDPDAPLKPSSVRAAPLGELMYLVGEARQADEADDAPAALDACRRAAAVAEQVDPKARAFVLGVAVEIAKRLDVELGQRLEQLAAGGA